MSRLHTELLFVPDEGLVWGTLFTTIRLNGVVVGEAEQSVTLSDGFYLTTHAPEIKAAVLTQDCGTVLLEWPDGHRAYAHCYPNDWWRITQALAGGDDE